MLTIRLQRTGRKNLPTYRVVVAEHARPVKGKFLEIVGFYLPRNKKDALNVDKPKIEAWVKKGAVVSDTLARLLKREGLSDMDGFIRRYAKQRSKNAPPEEPAAPTPAPAAVAAPAPAEAPAAPAEEPKGDSEPAAA